MTTQPATSTRRKKSRPVKRKSKSNPRIRTMHDPLLVRVRKAKASREEAEVEYGDAVIAALSNGLSYQQVAEAAITDKGTLHYWVQRYVKRRGLVVGKLGGDRMKPPAQV
jgi:hypothetical protein